MTAFITDNLVVKHPQPPWMCRWLAHRWCEPALRDRVNRVYIRRCRRCGWYNYGKPRYDGMHADFNWERHIYLYDDYGGNWPPPQETK